MNGLFDTATVLYGDGQWTSTYEVDALACGRQIKAVDICTPGTPTVPEDASTGYEVVPFAIVGTQKFSTRCAPEDARLALEQSMDIASEYQVAKNFWNGDVPDWESNLNLSDPDVATIARGPDVQTTLANVLATAFANHPEIQPIIHLGWLSALKLSASKADELDIDYCVSPGYPIDAVAVTGPIVVRLGSIEVLDSTDTTINRKYIAASRLAAVEFDPCLAVRAV